MLFHQDQPVIHFSVRDSALNITRNCHIDADADTDVNYYSNSVSFNVIHVDDDDRCKLMNFSLMKSAQSEQRMNLRICADSAQ